MVPLVFCSSHLDVFSRASAIGFREFLQQVCKVSVTRFRKIIVKASKAPAIMFRDGFRKGWAITSDLEFRNSLPGGNEVLGAGSRGHQEERGR